MSYYPRLQQRGFWIPPSSDASFSGASQGRRTKDWNPSSAGPNSSITGNQSTLRRRSRHLARNDPYGGSAIDKLVSNVVGTGIRPKSSAPDNDLAKEIDELHEDWSVESDPEGILDFYGQQAIVTRSALEGGECFVRMRVRRPEDDLSVPLQLQILESEHVPIEYNLTRDNGNYIRAGIEFDAIGRRRGYWMYSAHPGDAHLSAQVDDSFLKFVPAEEVLHVYNPERPGQVRGVPLLSGAILRLWGLDKFDDATLLRQEIASLYAGFVTKPAEDQGEVGEANPLTGQAPDDTDDDDVPMVGLEPGTMQELQPGEDVTFPSPPDAGNTYPEFMRQQLLAVAARVGVPYELLTGDMSNVNDRTLRGLLLEFRRSVEKLQNQMVIHQFCRPVRRKWADLAVASGALDVDNYRNKTKRRKTQRTRWVPQGWKHIHPVQDEQADREAVRSGFSSRAEKIRERGGDIETVDKENAADQRQADDLGLAYTTDGRYQLDPKSPLADNESSENGENS